MAKVVKFFAGSDSVGRDVQVAQSETGNWFWREYGWNGYGMGWSRWGTLPADQITHPTKLLNQSEYYNAPEYIELTPEQSESYIEWGFKCLHKWPSEKCRYRLPG